MYMKNKQYILDRVIYCLVNTERHLLELLALPHRDFLDLSAEYGVVLARPGGGSTCVKVSWETCNALGITEGELESAALFNTKRAGFVTKRMSELFSALIPPVEDDPLMVYTNKKKMFGASVILYPGEFKEYAEKAGSDLFILPSSIHELITIPAGMASSEDALRETVSEVNRTKVAADEVLSESVYRYSLSTGKITIA